MLRKPKIRAGLPRLHAERIYNKAFRSRLLLTQEVRQTRHFSACPVPCFRSTQTRQGTLLARNMYDVRSSVDHLWRYIFGSANACRRRRFWKCKRLALPLFLVVLTPVVASLFCSANACHRRRFLIVQTLVVATVFGSANACRRLRFL